MHGVWRPERRNRNIGTAAAGYSQSNDMRIPESWLDRSGRRTFYCERLDGFQKEEITVPGARLVLLYQPLPTGFTYGCTPAEVANVLDRVAGAVPALPAVVAFRLPTRKQRHLNPVWGRFLYLARIGRHEGPAIVLEAQQLGAPLRWSKQLSPQDRAEFERLVSDGHLVTETKRHFEARLTEGAIRNTILYRTLLHELGHLADYHEKVLDPRTKIDPDQDRALALYFARVAAEREAFAHAFAERLQPLVRAPD